MHLSEDEIIVVRLLLNLGVRESKSTGDKDLFEKGRQFLDRFNEADKERKKNITNTLQNITTEQNITTDPMSVGEVYPASPEEDKEMRNAIERETSSRIGQAGCTSGECD